MVDDIFIKDKAAVSTDEFSPRIIFSQMPASTIRTADNFFDRLLCLFLHDMILVLVLMGPAEFPER